MKILAFTPYGSMIGGANRSLMMVLSGLKNTYGHTIHVILPAKGQLSDALEKEGIEYSVIPSHTMSGVTSLSPINIYRLLRFHVRALKDRSVARKLAKRIQSEGYDAIYINDTDNYLGAFVAQEARLPYVWHFRSLIPPNMRFIHGARGLYQECSQIITISNRMATLLKENKAMPTKKITMIHNGIPYDNSIKLSPQSLCGGFHIVQCGRITPDKGHIDAILAMALLKQRGYLDIHLHIVGATPNGEDTEYLASLKAQITANGLDERITFEGLIADMPSFRENMNCELVCSVCEPFGRVTLEGMRSGLLVIGSNTGGTPEIIEDGVSGILYSQGSAEDLAEKIAFAYDNKEVRERIIKAAVDFSATHFTAEGNVREVNRVLCTAVEESKK